MPEKTIRIGGACGFWGDSFTATPQLLAGGAVDYLVYDYLAEITLSIMARARAKSPDQGYATDFVDVVMRQALPAIARQGVKVISNAGGMNPSACAAALERLCEDLGLSLTIAVVSGDDVLDRIAHFRRAGCVDMVTGAALREDFVSANAYLGAFPIAEALGAGADIVITGRCVDSAVTLAACIHAFGWTAEDLDLLAAGSLAGHIIECGAQATGGLFTDWREVPDWAAIGYPIAEVAADGLCTIEKPPGTGGLISAAAVCEQLVYEIGDPRAYILPDVICDFSDVRVEQRDADHVVLSGAKGRPPPDTYKVCATYPDGYRLGFLLTIIGLEADEKAAKTAAAVRTRLAGMLKRQGKADFSEVSVEIIGAEAAYGPHRRVSAPREVVLKIAAKHEDPAALSLLLREATSAGTSMAPGTTGMGGNRPRPAPVLRLFSFLAPKADIVPEVTVRGKTWPVEVAPGCVFDPAALPRQPLPPAPDLTGPVTDVPLIALAWGRSGDKGNDANIGIIARRPDYLPYIRAALSTEAVAACFAHVCKGPVERFEWPGIHALNFVLHNALGGGGVASLRNDPQGKGFAQMLMSHPVPVPEGVLKGTASP